MKTVYHIRFNAESKPNIFPDALYLYSHHICICLFGVRTNLGQVNVWRVVHVQLVNVTHAMSSICCYGIYAYSAHVSIQIGVRICERADCGWRWLRCSFFVCVVIANRRLSCKKNTLTPSELVMRAAIFMLVSFIILQDRCFGMCIWMDVLCTCMLTMQM